MTSCRPQALGFNFVVTQFFHNGNYQRVCIPWDLPLGTCCLPLLSISSSPLSPLRGLLPAYARFLLPWAGPFPVVATALPGPTLPPGPLYSQPPLVTVLGFLTHPNSQGMGALQSSLWVCALGQYDSCVMTHPGRAHTETERGVLPCTGQQPGCGWRSPWRSVSPSVSHLSAALSHCLPPVIDGVIRLAAQIGGTAFVKVSHEAQGPRKVVGGGLCLITRLESQGAASLLLPLPPVPPRSAGPHSRGQERRISALWWHWARPPLPPPSLCSLSSLFAPEDPPATTGSFSGVCPPVEGTR